MKTMTAAPEIRTRVRQRIAQLLDDRGMTQRDFARRCGHKDQWASNLLRGDFALPLDQLDTVARALGVPPSDLVRESVDPWELKPSEMRVIRALRMLPPVVSDHLMTLADYLIGTTPDEVELLRAIRALSDEDRHVVERWTEVMARAKAQGLDAAALADLIRTTAPPPRLTFGTPRKRTGKRRSPTPTSGYDASRLRWLGVCGASYTMRTTGTRSPGEGSGQS